MSESSEAKDRNKHGVTEFNVKPAAARTPGSIDIFAPPNEPVTFEEISSGWSKPIRASIEKIITAPEQSQPAETNIAPTQRKKIPTW